MKVWWAEFIGTFVMVFAGCGAIILGLPGVAVVFGLAVALMITAFGPISYAHFNPAVTVGFRALRLINNRTMLFYFSAEFSGAMAASLLHKVLFQQTKIFGENVPSVNVGLSLGLEILGTALLMGIIALVVTHPKFPKKAGAWSIGAMVAVISQFIGPYSGGSFNPARSFAPALMAGDLSHLWIYFLATPIGAWIAAKLVHQWTKGISRN